MKIDRFEIPGLAQYSYVISSAGEAAVIDPIRDVGRYVQYAAAHELKITHVLETHIHADFASGGTALSERTGAELSVSGHDEGEHYTYAMPHRRLCNGESILIGTVRLEALHTPGHTPEHLSFLLYDLERSANYPVALFSGDFLFVGSMGRPDLLGEEAKQGLAHELFRSAHDRIRHLPDSVELYPGHGAGSLCGSGMSERAESTLGYERTVNSLFKLDESAFVREILATVPAMPDYYPRLKALNSAGAPDVPASHGSSALSVDEVARLAGKSDVLLLDLRRPEAFGGAHIPSSINIGAGQNLSLWAGWLLDPAKRIVLIAQKGDDPESRLALIRVGLDRVEGYLAKGFPAWVEAGRELARIPQLSTGEVKSRAASAKVLDVRSDTEWRTGHIEGAQHLTLGNLLEKLKTVPQDQPLVAVCGSGYRSSIAASILVQHGFGSVCSMDGGMGAWNRRKLPVTKE
jgi:hydroxyacylglutathione hydrolase